MKKTVILIVIVFLSILLCGCNYDDNNKPNKYEAGQFINVGGSKKIRYKDGTTMYVRHFIYNGHKYIEFFRLQQGMDDNNTGYVHDPDCPCMSKK